MLAEVVGDGGHGVGEGFGLFGAISATGTA